VKKSNINRIEVNKMNIDPDVLKKEYREKLAGAMKEFFELDVFFTELSVFNPKHPIIVRKDGKKFTEHQNIFNCAFNQGWEKAELFFIKN
jgi:hypothetical protein